MVLIIFFQLTPNLASGSSSKPTIYDHQTPDYIQIIDEEDYMDIEEDDIEIIEEEHHIQVGTNDVSHAKFIHSAQHSIDSRCYITVTWIGATRRCP